MNDWTHHFSSLAKMAGDISPPSYHHRESIEFTADNIQRYDLHHELAAGFETTFEQLTCNNKTFTYRGIPVMAFGLCVTEVDDAKARHEFYFRVHLHNCCPAFTANRKVWISTDFGKAQQTNAKKLEQPLNVCHHCLNSSAFRGYASQTTPKQREILKNFNFHEYVDHYKESYFPHLNDQYWKSGTPPKSISLKKNTRSVTCPSCDWPLEKESQHLSARSPHSDQSQAICLCCLDQTEGVLILDNNTLLSAYRTRYQTWRDAYIHDQSLDTLSARNIKLSWGQISQHFPQSWDSIISEFRQFDPADIYYSLGRIDALMAWPSAKKAIVEFSQDKSLLPTDWQAWSRQEIEDAL